MPGSAAHTGTMACTACMAVPRQPWSFSSSSFTAILDSSTIDGRPSTLTFHPRPLGQSGAASGRSRVTCSTVRARRPSTMAVAENRMASTVPTSMRPAATSNASSATRTSRPKVAVLDGGAEPLGHQHQRRPEHAAEDGRIGADHARVVGRPAEAHDVEEHEGVVVGRVVEQLLDEQRLDVAEDARHRQREHLRGPARLDAGGVEAGAALGAGRLDAVDDRGAHGLRARSVA